MKRALAVAIASVALTSCTRTVRDASMRTPVTPRPRVSAVNENIRRQVMNAVDAGEGDVRVRALRQRIATNPDDWQSRLDLAELYTRSGFPDVALEHLRIAAQRFPDAPEVAMALARTLHRQGLHSEARSGLEPFLASHPGAGPDLWSLLGILQDATGDYASAERSHRAAVERQDRSDAYHNNLGYNLLLQGRKSDAAAEFRRALELNPGSTLARNNLGAALADQPDEAVHQLQSVTDAASAHNNLAAVLIERGEYQAARRELELALGYRKDHPAALNNLELVTTLDRGLLPNGQNDSSWRRFVRTMGLVFLGSETTESKPAAPGSANGQAAPAGAGSQ